MAGGVIGERLGQRADPRVPAGAGAGGEGGGAGGVAATQQQRQLAGGLGVIGDGKRLMAAAWRAVRTTSALAVAGLLFQWGRLLEEAGDVSGARDRYALAAVAALMGLLLVTACQGPAVGHSGFGSTPDATTAPAGSGTSTAS